MSIDIFKKTKKLTFYGKKQKLEYIGLNLEEIPETLKLVEDLQFRPNAGFDEKNTDNIDLYHLLDDINPVEMKMLSEQVDIILRALELYAYNLEYMLDGEKSSDDEKQKKIAMLKYTYEQVLSDQAEQVNTKRNNTNNLTAYGQKMINDSNIINMIPKNKDIRAV